MEGDIEIPIPGSSRWPAERVKKWVNIITTAAALIIGIAALVKPSEDPSVQRETVKQLQLQHDELIHNHDLIVELQHEVDDCKHNHVYSQDPDPGPMFQNP